MMTPEVISTLRQAAGALPTRGDTNVARLLFEALQALDIAQVEWDEAEAAIIATREAALEAQQEKIRAGLPQECASHD